MQYEPFMQYEAVIELHRIDLFIQFKLWAICSNLEKGKRTCKLKCNRKHKIHCKYTLWSEKKPQQTYLDWDIQFNLARVQGKKKHRIPMF